MYWYTCFINFLIALESALSSKKEYKWVLNLGQTKSKNLELIELLLGRQISCFNDTLFHIWHFLVFLSFQ